MKNNLHITKSHLKGSVLVPSSKSHSIRAILLGTLANGLSTIRYPLESPDIKQAMIAAEHFGAKLTHNNHELYIHGTGGQIKTNSLTIDVGNSGQVLRFGAALAALGNNEVTFTGDHSIQTNRIIQPLLTSLNDLGASASSLFNNGFAPIKVKGALKPGVTTLAGQDSQPISALLMAASFVDGKTTIHVEHPGETPWIDLTLSWLTKLGVDFTNENYEKFTIQGNPLRKPFDITIPGDFSSAAFPVIAALITNSEITLKNIDMDDIQGDKELIFLLQKMGAEIDIDHNKRCLHVKKGPRLQGQVIDVNHCIDALPILAVLGCFVEGETRLINAAIARNKESDRIACISKELKKMGATISPTPDGLIIHPSALNGAQVDSHNDHRIALSLIVAGFAAQGKTIVHDIDCIKKSYPSFVDDMKKVGAQIEQK